MSFAPGVCPIYPHSTLYHFHFSFLGCFFLSVNFPPLPHYPGIVWWLLMLLLLLLLCWFGINASNIKIIHWRYLQMVGNPRIGTGLLFSQCGCPCRFQGECYHLINAIIKLYNFSHEISCVSFFFFFLGIFLFHFSLVILLFVPFRPHSLQPVFPSKQFCCYLLAFRLVIHFKMMQFYRILEFTTWQTADWNKSFYFCLIPFLRKAKNCSLFENRYDRMFMVCWWEKIDCHQNG